MANMFCAFVAVMVIGASSGPGCKKTYEVHVNKKNKDKYPKCMSGRAIMLLLIKPRTRQKHKKRKNIGHALV